LPDHNWDPLYAASGGKTISICSHKKEEICICASILLCLKVWDRTNRSKSQYINIVGAIKLIFLRHEGKGVVIGPDKGHRKVIFTWNEGGKEREFSARLFLIRSKNNK